MSAYMVSKHHIDALVTLAKLKRVMNVTQAECNPDDEIEDVAGRRLVAENRKSINSRYPDTVGNVDGEPGDHTNDEPYTYSMVRRIPTTVEGLKLVACYMYQACEHEGWRDSWAHRLCSHLRSALISSLPGYSEAAWEADGS